MNREQAVCESAMNGLKIRRPGWMKDSYAQWKDGCVRNRKDMFMCLEEADDYEVVPAAPVEPELVEVKVEWPEPPRKGMGAWIIYTGGRLGLVSCAAIVGFGGYVYQLPDGVRWIAVTPAVLWCGGCHSVRFSSHCWLCKSDCRVLHPSAVLLPREV